METSNDNEETRSRSSDGGFIELMKQSAVEDRSYVDTRISTLSFSSLATSTEKEREMWGGRFTAFISEVLENE
jgi:hypothetical protein